MPQVQRGIGPPRAPAFGACEQLAWRGAPPVRVRERAEEADIGGGERVRFPEGAHRNVLRRPFADAGQLAQPGQRRFDVRAGR